MSKVTVSILMTAGMVTGFWVGLFEGYTGWLNVAVVVLWVAIFGWLLTALFIFPPHTTTTERKAKTLAISLLNNRPPEWFLMGGDLAVMGMLAYCGWFVTASAVLMMVVIEGAVIRQAMEWSKVSDCGDDSEEAW